ncbi:octaprenyl diphosphate synthase [Lachnospiraceae bacterium KM106-2]|nr:octaprenyl diphosphate synthase [Lachnospiraceae bacterium KM106-2]
MEFREALSEKKQEVDQIVKSFMPKEEGYQKIILEAMNYSLNAGGKRLRPMLMQECFYLFQGEKEEVLHPFMAAMEMIHTYSLVHDDLPAMDDDEYRRGRKTTHIVFGEDMGILAGDALLNYAYETVAQAFSVTESLSRSAKAFQVLAKKAGVYGMVGGQVVDVEMTNKPIPKDKLDFIFALKTSALIEASMMIGAILAGASDSEVAKIERIANRIGLAFQIQDDILDVTSTTEVLGKPVLSDEKNNKTTYVTLVGLEKAKEEVEALTKEAVVLLEEMPYENEFLNQLLLALVNRKK